MMIQKSNSVGASKTKKLKAMEAATMAMSMVTRLKKSRRLELTRRKRMPLYTLITRTSPIYLRKESLLKTKNKSIKKKANLNKHKLLRREIILTSIRQGRGSKSNRLDKFQLIRRNSPGKLLLREEETLRINQSSQNHSEEDVVAEEVMQEAEEVILEEEDLKEVEEADLEVDQEVEVNQEEEAVQEVAAEAEDHLAASDTDLV